MEYNVLSRLLGEDWADFMKDFMCPDTDGKCRYDEIGAVLKPLYDGGKAIYPAKNQVFRAFQETPLKDVRVVLLNTEPYPVEGFSNGLAFSTDNEKLPASLQQVYDAIEADVYNGIDYTKPKRTGTLGKVQEDGSVKTWSSQGVLLLNAALTIEGKQPGSHLELWKPFTEFVISKLWKVKRDLIFLGWGAHAKSILQYRGNANPNDTDDTSLGVNIFHATVLTAEHPVDAAKGKRKWVTDNFSKTNLIMRINKLGAPIEW